VSLPTRATNYTLTVRRRRQPEEAEAEILDAAELLLRGRSPDDLSVSAVMAGTTLTRNAFYVYFADRYELLARLVARLRTQADATMSAFADPDADPSPTGKDALRAAARLYADHGELLLALSQAAVHDPGAARAWSEFVEPSHKAVVARVRAEMKEGRIEGIDPEPTVRALVAMNRACFFGELVGKPGADVDALVDILHEIWMRALYLKPAAPAGRRRRSPRRRG
jgi:TetR/AcrR family transcriptional regulator, ethionamide resistance regulator